MSVIINGTTGITSPSPFVLEGSTSGTITVAAPAIAGTNTQTLAAVTGTLAPIVSGTAVSASGTSVDFTDIPSWVKRITVMFSGVSTSGTSAFLIKLGISSGFVTSGYSSAGSNIGTGSTGISGSTAGFILVSGNIAANTYDGSVTVNLINVSSNAWVSSGVLRRSSNDSVSVSGGNTALADTLTQIRITTVNGTDTFDAGTINILYE